MKNILILTLLIATLVACRKDNTIKVGQKVPITNDLRMIALKGIKLQTPFVTNEVLMNVKLETNDVVTIKIIDIANRVVSKEEVNATAGDNLFKVYTTALPSSAYRIALYGSNGVMIGITDFNKL